MMYSNLEGKSVCNFMAVTPNVLYKKLGVLNGKKATIVDNIPPWLVKSGAVGALFSVSIARAIF